MRKLRTRKGRQYFSILIKFNTSFQSILRVEEIEGLISLSIFKLMMYNNYLIIKQSKSRLTEVKISQYQQKLSKTLKIFIQTQLVSFTHFLLLELTINLYNQRKQFYPQTDPKMQNSQIINLVGISNNKLIINQQGILKLKQIQGKVFPICCVGPILTGKSEFLNLVTGRNLFPINSTTMPKTKGINAYFEEIVKDGDSVWKLYLDVQGFDDSFNDGNEEIDRNLLLVLLSTCKLIFYHSFGALESTVFQRLSSLKTLLPQKLQNRPQIILLQKNFSLKLVNKDQKSLTQQQYLEYCMNNFKDKDAISNLDGMFERLHCFTLAHSGDKDKFRKGMELVKNYIQTKFLEFCFDGSEQFQLTNFIYSFVKSIELINSKKTLQKVYEQAKKQKLEQSKNWFALYKSSTNQKIKNELKQCFPIPHQLLMFKLKNIFKECSGSLGNYGKSQQNFINQAIGPEIIMEVDNKIISKLSSQNQIKIRQFIVKKMEQFMQQYRNQELCLDRISRIEGQIVENLRNYYAFIGESHQDYIKLQIGNLFIKILLERNSVKINETQIYKKQQQAYVLSLQDQIKKLSSSLTEKLTDKEKKINQLESKLEQTKKQNQQLLLIQQQRQSRISQAQKQMQKYHETMKNHAEHGENLLKQIQTNLKQNLMYEKQPKSLSERQQNQLKEGTKIILTSINRIFELIKNSNENTKDEERRQFQKIVHLEKMNKGLRQRIQELMGSSCVDIVEKKYNEASNQLKQKQKFIQILAEQKELIIEKLRTELRYHNQTIKALQFELQLSKSRVIDKSKTSEFMDRLMQTKQNLLEQARLEMLENLTKYKEEINAVRTEYRKKQLELSDTVSMFAVKNEQLTARNNELSNKLNTLQKRLKKQTEEKLLQKQSQIGKLSENLASFESNLMMTTETYMQVTSEMEKLIKQKDESIFGLTLTVQRLQDKAKALTYTLENIQTKYEELKGKSHRLELEKQQFQSKIKREQILSNNRLKHLQQINEKLKSQIKQKESTFEMMLLQLRSQSVISNNNQRSNSMLRENSRQRYIKRIDQIEEIAMRELDEISNKEGKRSSIKPQGHNKTVGKSEVETNDENYPKMEYRTDKKKTSKLSHEYSESKLSTLGTHNPNKPAMMFRMLSKGI